MSDNPDTTTTPSTEGETGNGNGNSDNNTSTGTGTGRVPRQGNGRTYNPNQRKTGNNTFKGDTAKMNGHVFQLHSERNNKSQFGDTVKALRVYSSEVFKNDIESLTILFTDLVKST